MELQSLVEQVQDDINSTTVLQQQVTENITTIQDMVDDTFNQIDQANYYYIEQFPSCFNHHFTFRFLILQQRLTIVHKKLKTLSIMQQKRF